MAYPPRKVCIAHVAGVTALGDSVEATWRGLCEGRSAVRPVTRFATDALGFHTAACVLDSDCPNLTLDLLGRTLDQLPSLPPETFVVWTGVKGNVEAIERGHGAGADGFPSLPEHYLEWVRRRFGLSDDGSLARGLSVNAACASSTVGIALAADRVASGEAACALVCAADIVSRFTFTGFSALKALSPSACRPFDIGRDGLCLGDGAGAAVLCDETTAESRGWPVLGVLRGWGVANDANHITGPARDGCGLIAAVRQSLEHAEMLADEVEAFCAHGTGTVFNDAMELMALETLFGPRRFPLFSVKGATGHTLGAAGVLETALSLRALAEGIVPPTVGLQIPEPRAEGRVSLASERIPGRNILTTNSGFGGVNAALLLQRAG